MATNVRVFRYFIETAPDAFQNREEVLASATLRDQALEQAEARLRPVLLDWYETNASLNMVDMGMQLERLLLKIVEESDIKPLLSFDEAAALVAGYANKLAPGETVEEYEAKTQGLPGRII
jgi:hypothetical protein